MSAYDSPIVLVFLVPNQNIFAKFQRGHSLMAALETGGVHKFPDSRPVSGNTLEAV